MSDSRADFDKWIDSLGDDYDTTYIYPDQLWQAWQASRAQPERKPMPDCCDTPNYCSASRRCTAQDSAQPERKMTDAEIHKIWQDSYLVALKNAGFCIGNSDVAHMNQPVVFARALLAAQPAAATVPDATFIDEGSIPSPAELNCMERDT